MFKDYLKRRKLRKNPKYCFECVRKIDKLSLMGQRGKDRYFCSVECIVHNAHQAIKALYPN